MGPHPRPCSTKASPDEAESARGPLAIESRRGVRISTEQKKLHKDKALQLVSPSDEIKRACIR
jgi:hypothetical protein